MHSWKPPAKALQTTLSGSPDRLQDGVRKWWKQKHFQYYTEQEQLDMVAQYKHAIEWFPDASKKVQQAHKAIWEL